MPRNPDDLVNLPPTELKSLNDGELNSLYWGKGLSIGEIAKLKNRSVATIFYHMKRKRISRRDKSTAIKLSWKTHPRLFNQADLRPSPELAYVIGAIKGDGCLCYQKYKGCYRVNLSCKDKDFAEQFWRYLSVIMKHPVHPPYLSKALGLYIVKTESKQLYEFLKRTNVEEIGEKFPASFIRGYADADGSAFYYRDHYHNKPFVRVSFDSTDPQLLETVKKLLWEKVNIKTTKIYNGGLKDGVIKKTGQVVIARHPAYKFFIIRRDAVRRYASEIGFSIKRKQDKLEEGMRLAGYE